MGSMLLICLVFCVVVVVFLSSSCVLCTKFFKCLDCPFLIASSVFSNVYLSISLDCPFLIASSVFFNVYLSVSQDCPASSVFSNVYLSVSLDCPFLIASSVFSSVYLSVSLDCPFLIAPSISCAQGWQCSGLSILDCSFNLVCPRLTVRIKWIERSRNGPSATTIYCNLLVFALEVTFPYTRHSFASRTKGELCNWFDPFCGILVLFYRISSGVILNE